MKELFNECINRVGAMALVHEQTYLSKDLANIDVKTYLESLVRDLIHAYAVGIRLKQDIDIQVRTLSVDTLVPMGLLINKMISNSFKYAFKGRSEGLLTVHLSGSEDGGLHLRIGDNGPGMPSRDKWDRPNSLGMELVGNPGRSAGCPHRPDARERHALRADQSKHNIDRRWA